MTAPIAAQVTMRVNMEAFTFTRAEIVASNRWPDHDPGDEDEPSWVCAPVAPSRSLWNALMRQAAENER